MRQTIPFTKMHGTGNDFIVIDALDRPVRLTPDLARRLCDRRFGAGADQILVLGPSRKADFSMRIVNADGSEVEMCGNGIRCLALYAREKGRTSKAEMSFETPAGIIRPSLGKDSVRVDMGPPVLDAAKIPTRGRGRIIDLPLGRIRPALPLFPEPGGEGNGKELLLTCVSMGNPHAVLFVDDLDAVPAAEWGPRIENHPFFPKRVNVEFVQTTGPRTARVRVWERGAGLTMACGTGACAVAVAGVLTGRFQRDVELSLPGGGLRVEWAADNRVYLTGPAAFVYEGRFLI